MPKCVCLVGGPEERLPVARALAETSLMFHVHPTLSAEDMNDTVTAVKKVMARAEREFIEFIEFTQFVELTEADT